MYLDFFGFSKKPFNVIPDPDFFYLSPDHREALASLFYGVEQQKGFIVITGEVGVGKSTVIRTYLDLVDRTLFHPLYLSNSHLPFDDLLKTILRHLMHESIAADRYEMMNLLHRKVAEESAEGRSIVLIFDEAQNMPVETLENIRLLSEPESPKEIPLQIVFSAQPEFETLLARHELRQLQQMIAVKTTIQALSVKESILYIKHRLSIVTPNFSSLFSSYALRLLARMAKGAPRLINIYCDNW
jgi:general secretion pathway protein A